jgi:hypothetical protein
MIGDFDARASQLGFDLVLPASAGHADVRG